MMVSCPAAIDVKFPEASIVPKAVEPEETLQAPDGEGSLYGDVTAAHIEEAPVIASGSGFTVTMVDEEHPVALNVKETSVVPPPVATPVTTPDVPTVAMDGLMLLHVPAPDASLNAMVEPVHTPNDPVLDVITAGAGITFAVDVAVQPLTGDV